MQWATKCPSESLNEVLTIMYIPLNYRCGQSCLAVQGVRRVDCGGASIQYRQRDAALAYGGQCGHCSYYWNWIFAVDEISISEKLRLRKEANGAVAAI